MYLKSTESRALKLYALPGSVLVYDPMYLE